ncbi:hypothetical protein V2J09_004493 [Rumex salicifolius]
MSSPPYSLRLRIVLHRCRLPLPHSPANSLPTDDSNCIFAPALTEDGHFAPTDDLGRYFSPLDGRTLTDFMHTRGLRILTDFRHIDESVELEDGKRTHYTLLLYLRGGPKPKGKTEPNNSSEPEPLIGGETIFYSYMNSILAEVAPLEGRALFHIHGDKCMLHEVMNVTKQRWIFGVKLMPQQSTSTKSFVSRMFESKEKKTVSKDFVATWNVGGSSPSDNLNLDAFNQRSHAYYMNCYNPSEKPYRKPFLRGIVGGSSNDLDGVLVRGFAGCGDLSELGSVHVGDGSEAGTIDAVWGLGVEQLRGDNCSQEIYSQRREEKNKPHKLIKLILKDTKSVTRKYRI